jgi:hypothetical protein
MHIGNQGNSYTFAKLVIYLFQEVNILQCRGGYSDVFSSRLHSTKDLSHLTINIGRWQVRHGLYPDREAATHWYSPDINNPRYSSLKIHRSKGKEIKD